MTYKTQEIITKCLKEFDLRLFKEIGGNVTREMKTIKWERQEKKKSTSKEPSLRELKKEIYCCF